MNKDKIKRLIILMLIAILIVVTVLILLIMKNFKVNNNNQEITMSKIELQKIEDIKDAYKIEKFINMGLESIYDEILTIQSYQSSGIENKEDINVDMKKYEEYRKLLEELDMVNDFQSFHIEKAYILQINNKNTIYFSQGYLIRDNLSQNNSKTKQDVTLTILKDNETSRCEFGIYGKQYLELFDYNENIEEIQFDQDKLAIFKKNITDEFDSGYLNSEINDKELVNWYYEDYKIKALYFSEEAYESLDEEYRNKRFGSIENYRQYITDNKAQLQNSAVKEYNSSEKEGYTQYVVVDTSGNYYIFKSTGVMEYTVITDFYTTDIEEIVNKYDESNVQGKVAINIQKVIAALNSKDYKYVYSKLSEEFKANKYPTLEQFKEYISTKLYDNVQMSFGEFRNEGDTYIYNIILKSTKISQGNPINMQIIMKLTDNRDYVMSFNIQ